MLEHVTTQPTPEQLVDPPYMDVDRSCQLLIVRHVNAAILEQISELPTAYEMCERLTQVYEFKGISTRRLVKRELQGLKFVDGGDLTTFFEKFEALSRKYRFSGGELTQDELVEILFEAMPESFETIISVLEVTQRGKVACYESAKSCLLEFGAKTKSKQMTNTTGAAAFEVQANEKSQKKYDKKQVVCYNCGKRGHKSFQCKAPKKEKKKMQSEQKGYAVLGATTIGNVTSTGNTVRFIIDSGATEHLVTSAGLLDEIEDVKNPFNISVAKEEEHLEVRQAGSLSVTSLVNGAEVNVDIKRAYVAEGLRHNLFSVRKVAMMGGEVRFKGNNAYVIMNGDTIAIGHRVGYLYYLEFKRVEIVANVADGSAGELWHRRLGHLHISGVKKLINDKLAVGVKESVTADTLVCEPCVMGKATRKPFNGSRPPTTRALERVHSDVAGPMDVPSFDGHQYYVTFIDDFTHLTVTYLISSKGEVFNRFQQYHKMASAHFNSKMVCLRSDGGGEYMSNQFSEYLKNNGIQHEVNAPYNPEQNGVAERMNCTLKDKATAMLADSRLPKQFWGEAVMAATYLLNRSPTVALGKTTPFEKWFGRKPDISNLRIFGCLAYALTPKQKRKAFDMKTSSSTMVGYDTNGYRLYDHQQQKVIVARNVNFNERSLGAQLVASSTKNSAEKPLELQPTVVIETQQVDHQPQSDSSLQVNDEQQQQESFVEVESRYPRRDRRPPERYGDVVEWSDVSGIDDSVATLSYCAAAWAEDVPATYDEAVNGHEKAEWRSAINEELRSLESNQTWRSIDKPPDVKLLRTKWVFKRKEEPDNSIRFKARLVACGYQQKAGVDYTETYSPVARLATIRIVLAVGLQNRYQFRHLDVKTAFLNENLEDTIYLKPPDGVRVEPGKVLQLQRSLYGLKQAPKCWNKHFDSFVCSLGFKKSSADSCLYIRIDGDVTNYLVLYVDGMLIASSKSVIEQLIQQFNDEFQMSDLGLPSKFMGMKIVINEEEGLITLDQAKYTRQILQRYGMIDCKAVNTPMEALPQSTGSQQTNEPYSELIGSVMYLVMGTRPGLAFSLGYLSRQQATPTEADWIALKRILRYLIPSNFSFTIAVTLIRQHSPDSLMQTGHQTRPIGNQPVVSCSRYSATRFNGRRISNKWYLSQQRKVST